MKLIQGHGIQNEPSSVAKCVDRGAVNAAVVVVGVVDGVVRDVASFVAAAVESEIVGSPPPPAFLQGAQRAFVTRIDQRRGMNAKPISFRNIHASIQEQTVRRGIFGRCL